MDRNITIPAAGQSQKPQQQKPAVLPEIRQDLALYAAEYDVDGAPLWHLHDPLANKYYRMNDRDVQMLALFGQKDAKELKRINQLIFKFVKFIKLRKK